MEKCMKQGENIDNINNKNLKVPDQKIYPGQVLLNWLVYGLQFRFLHFQILDPWGSQTNSRKKKLRGTFGRE